MALKITITSIKDGVGNTTFATNRGALLADLGQKVFQVDVQLTPSSDYMPRS